MRRSTVALAKPERAAIIDDASATHDPKRAEPPATHVVRTCYAGCPAADACRTGHRSAFLAALGAAHIRPLVHVDLDAIEPEDALGVLTVHRCARALALVF